VTAPPARQPQAPRGEERGRPQEEKPKAEKPKSEKPKDDRNKDRNPRSTRDE
jgi:hypothetical protein